MSVNDEAALIASLTKRITALERAASREITTGMIADDAITTAKIAAGTIATADIADGAVTQAKITPPTVTSWTPTLRQSNSGSGGNITIAGNSSYYWVQGEWVFGRFQFSVAAGQAGTAANYIKIGLPPVTPDVLVGSFGVGNLYDNDPGYRYPALLDMISSTEFWLSDSSLGGASWALGNSATYALALAQNDGFSGSFMYRKA